MFSDNKNLFTCPDFLIAKMLSKVDFRNKQVKNILEPSAGLGHIIDYINKDLNRYKSYNISAIEIDKEYQRIGKELAIDTKNILMLK